MFLLVLNDKSMCPIFLSPFLLCNVFDCFFRLLIKNGNNIDSPPVYDSYEVEYLPNEGVVSTGRHLFVEFTTDGTVTSTGAAIRYEGTDAMRVSVSHVCVDYINLIELY